MKIKAIVMNPVDFGNLHHGYYQEDQLNEKLKGAVKVDVFKDHNGYVTFLAQWPDEDQP
jgi:hypothetical protein